MALVVGWILCSLLCWSHNNPLLGSAWNKSQRSHLRKVSCLCNHLLALWIYSQWGHREEPDRKAWADNIQQGLELLLLHFAPLQLHQFLLDLCHPFHLLLGCSDLRVLSWPSRHEVYGWQGRKRRRPGLHGVEKCRRSSQHRQRATKTTYGRRDGLMLNFVIYRKE